MGRGGRYPETPEKISEISEPFDEQGRSSRLGSLAIMIVGPCGGFVFTRMGGI
jgi:hypothetical protein